MVNILITACYNLEDKRGMKKTLEMSFSKYKTLTEICVGSFRKHLKDLDEVVVLKGTAENYHRMFQDIYYNIQKIYKARECNILWVDSDCVCVRPVEIFGEYDKFTMFEIQNQHGSYRNAKVPARLYVHLRPWMMSNVRYYPHGGITDDMWRIGDQLASNWIDVWAYECIIHNSMFHAQNMPEHEIRRTMQNKNLNFLKPSGNVTLRNLPHKAAIIHLHSAVDIDRAIMWMKELTGMGTDAVSFSSRNKQNT